MNELFEWFDVPWQGITFDGGRGRWRRGVF
jgi:hypothetical protein